MLVGSDILGRFLRMFAHFVRLCPCRLVFDPVLSEMCMVWKTHSEDDAAVHTAQPPKARMKGIFTRSGHPWPSRLHSPIFVLCRREYCADWGRISTCCCQNFKFTCHWGPNEIAGDHVRQQQTMTQGLAHAGLNQAGELAACSAGISHQWPGSQEGPHSFRADVCMKPT